LDRGNKKAKEAESGSGGGKRNWERRREGGMMEGREKGIGKV